MIKVLQLRSSPFLGSPEKIILGLVRATNNISCQHFLGIFDEQPGKENKFSKSAEHLNCQYMMLHDSMFYVLLNLYKIYKLFLRANIDIICTHDYKSNFYGLVLGKSLKKPIISIFHGRTGSDFKVRIYEKWDNYVLRYFDGIICVSRDIREKIGNIIKNKKPIFVIPNAVDIRQIEELSQKEIDTLEFPLKEGNEKLVVYAGRLSREKGLFYFIEAAKRVLSNSRNVKFIILGDGAEKEKIGKMIRENNLNEFVYLLGFRDNVYVYFRVMDFLVLPSLAEGMPMVILEAFALGKPVVATRVGGIPEIVRDGFNGVLVHPRDVDSLAKSIDTLIMDTAKTVEMGRNGYAFINKNHTFEAQAQKYVSVYEAVINRRQI